jgi:hypothetical protein
LLAGLRSEAAADVSRESDVASWRVQQC